MNADQEKLIQYCLLKYGRRFSYPDFYLARFELYPEYIMDCGDLSLADLSRANVINFISASGNAVITIL